MRAVAELSHGYILLADPDDARPLFRTPAGTTVDPASIRGERIAPVLVTALIRAEGRARKMRDGLGAAAALKARAVLEDHLREEGRRRFE